MNPSQLLAQFDRFSDAPGAIPRLRRLILDIAVRGKLVEQNLRDEPASELLKRIEDDVRERKARREFTEPRNAIDVAIDSLPFNVPPSWRWTRLIEIADVSYGFAFESSRFNSNKVGMPLIRIRDISGTDTQAYYQGEHDPAYVVSKGDYLVGMDGDFNVRKWKGPDALLNQRVMRIKTWRAALVAEFLSIPLQMILDHLHASTSQTTVKHLSAKQVNGVYLPIPPIAEQLRIVAKVDELMALCDRLEAAQAERESRRDRLAAASLHRLNNGADPDAFRDHARFYFNHLPRLTTRHEHVKKLRGAILNLAFRGWLTSPWRETAEFVGTAQEFRLSVENARRKAWDNKQVAGSSRKYLSPIEFDRENLPTIPDSWVWTSADAICSQITDGEHIQPRYQPEGLPMLTAKHVREGFVTFEDSELISESDFKKCVARCKPEEGDILVVSVGATTGRAAIVSQSQPFALVRSVLLLKPLISPAYFLRWLQSPWCFVWMRQASEASAQPHLYIGDTRRMPVPLPPLAEQQRIVAKVDALMALCDRLEVQLTTTQTESRRLLEAVLHEALAQAV